ncbi:MAG: thiamine pyrophosphate-dependent dehydrogenase E1 component subunit alpha [Anaerolineales bacterium]
MILEASPENIYRTMLRIRLFEERVLDWFPRGVFFGTTHTYIGQEADAAGVMTALQEGDIVVSNHRCHGHFLAYGGSMEALAAELMGKKTGVCAGRGGSQHIQWRDFYANGILGGTLPLAMGMALAEKARGSGAIVAAFLGDGALGEGAVYESLNIASLWDLPLWLIVENNRYAQSTPIELNLAGSIALRFQAFDIPVVSLEAEDALVVAEMAQQMTRSIRESAGPRALILETYRFGPHSKGDDSRDPQEIARFRAKDPLQRLAAELEPEARASIAELAQQDVEAAFQAAEAAPLATPDQLSSALESAE